MGTTGAELPQHIPLDLAGGGPWQLLHEADEPRTGEAWQEGVDEGA